MRSRHLIPVLAAPVLAVTLAACGTPAVDTYVKTAPATVDQDLRTALTGLKSVHVETKQTSGDSSFTMSMSIDNAGRCSGTLTQGTQTLTLIAVSSTKLYAKASADFWTQTEGVKADISKKLADKWLTGLPQGMFSAVCDIKSLVKSFTTQEVAKDKAKVLGKTKVDGTDGVNLQITVGGSNITITVAADKPHYPLQMSSGGGKRVSVLSKFDESVKVTAPTGAQDINQLAKAK